MIESDRKDYTFQLRKRRWWPWLLLLLLLLLLLPLCCTRGCSDAVRMADVEFRTVVYGTGELLPDCDLLITDSEGNSYKPENSGNGEFVVKDVPLKTSLSIIAMKDGYATNDYTIDDVPARHLLQAPQHQRDIPLMRPLPPCDATGSGENNADAGSVSPPLSYNMGVDSGTFDLRYATGGACPDSIEVYNHAMGEDYDARAPIWTSRMQATGGFLSADIAFSHGSVITIVVITGPSSGSYWEYHIDCPK